MKASVKGNPAAKKKNKTIKKIIEEKIQGKIANFIIRNQVVVLSIHLGKMIAWKSRTKTWYLDKMQNEFRFIGR